MNTLRREKSPNSRKTILLAMSGGVDSTAAAALLRDQGYEVIGVTMLLWRDQDEAEVQAALKKKSEDLARRLGLEHYCLDLSAEFYQAVVEPFMAAYRRGETPNPCVLCNRKFKFDLLLRRAAAHYCAVRGQSWQDGDPLPFDFIATGHYARVKFDEKKQEYQLLRALDRKKDQSYVLYSLGQELLAKLILPLGELSKEDARAIAAAAGTPISKEEESQDICFISHSYRELLEAHGGFGCPGFFVDGEGHKLAPHEGIGRFTLGQRKGLGHAFGRRVSVIDINPTNGNVEIGEESALYFTEIELNELRFNTREQPQLPLHVEVATRYQQPPRPAILLPLEPEVDSRADVKPAAKPESVPDKVAKDISDRALLHFEEPQRASCPGQAAVFYLGERVIGGGSIVRKNKSFVQNKESKNRE